MEQEIAQWVHPMKDRSDDPLHHEQTLLPSHSRKEEGKGGGGRKEMFSLMHLTSTIGEIPTGNERVYEYEPCSSLYRINSIGNERVYEYEPCSSLYRINSIGNERV